MLLDTANGHAHRALCAPSDKQTGKSRDQSRADGLHPPGLDELSNEYMDELTALLCSSSTDLRRAGQALFALPDFLQRVIPLSYIKLIMSSHIIDYTYTRHRFLNLTIL